MANKTLITIPTRYGMAGAGLACGKVAHLWLPGLSEGALRQRMAAWAGQNAEVQSSGGLAERITAYFEGEAVDFPDPADLSGLSPFQRLALTTLREKVGRGQIITYLALARLAGKPGAARAVGGAMARNPVPLIIPCHRVIRSDGGLGGFSGPGETRLKRLMLELEGIRNKPGAGAQNT